MSTSTFSAGQRVDSERMGVASMSTKRRLESSDADLEYPSPIKVAKKSVFIEPDPAESGHRFSSEFLTTSILARTLLTSSNPSSLPNASPLESLKSSLQTLPPPSFLESMEELHASGPYKATTIGDGPDLEFSGLLPHTTITVLSPIDEGGSWNGLAGKTASAFGMMSEQVITEDENGKSYFNLGPSEATVLAKKSSSSPSNSPPDQTWTANSSNVDYLDEASSSSSCESISSEDLFNSCEEYDLSEDEEEVRTYKQERSNVLHLSLCKLNMFRTQQCVEPSLHRSVLICNTLRHIEQEIKSEDEVRTGESFLESRETLPPFWPPASSPSSGGNASSNNNVSGQQMGGNGPLPSPSPPTHDPYLAPNPYTESSYSAPYDYNSGHRPAQTPFHRASYDYAEPDPAAQSAPLSSELAPSPMECDSGYSENMSSYYYAPPPPVVPEGGDYMACSPTYDILPPSSVTSIVESLSSAADLLQNPAGSDMGMIGDSPNGLVEDGLNCSSDYLDNSSSSESSTSSMVEALEGWSKSAITTFAQHDGQCGMESLRSDFSLGSHGHPHHHQLPMDSLVSSTYSST